MFDLQDAVFSGKRKYNIINNPDGTISLDDVTEYTNPGSDINAAFFNDKVQEKAVSGTFTPTVNGIGASYLNRVGKFTIIGNVCTLHIRIALSSKGSIDDNLIIGGIPSNCIPNMSDITFVTVYLDNGSIIKSGYVRDGIETNISYSSLTNTSAISVEATYILD